MPYSSADISGMIGGQMAMFSNQAAYSQQLGGMIGTGPMMGGGGMANPFPQPHMGSQIAGGMAMGVGGAATGASIAGGLMGGAAGWADPFTAGARGFMGGHGGFGGVGAAFRGAGGGLRGFGAGMSAIGGGIAQGGVRGMAAGIGMAGVAALPATAGMMAASYAGGQMYQGVQNLEDVRGMSGHFGTQFGQPGAGMGGQMGHQTIKKITGALHELVGEDMHTTMEEIKSVMDRAGRMGMLTGITDAQTFKQKFGNIVKQVRQVADIMGTTLSEAAPMLGQLGQMGLWSGGDIMGTAVAGRMAGQAAPQMMQSMQQGAMVSHAMGGTMRAGAMMGRESFMDVQAAQRAGVLSNRDIMEYTGGVGGAQGQRMMAGSIQGMMSKFGQTSPGRLMMAGLGARGEGGEFTGEIDPERMQEFLGGGITVGGLQKLGRQNLTRGNQASFFDVQGELGQNLGAQGGIGAMGKITQQVLDRMGGEPKLRQQLMRQMFGVSNREAKMLGKLMDDMPKIRDEQSRAAEDAINQAFEQLEQKQYRSWGALKEAVSGSFREGVSRPLQEAGERIAADFGEAWDRTMDSVTGRTRRIAMGTKEKQRLIRGGALTTDYSQMGLEGVGQGFVSGGGMENLIRGIQQEGMGQIAGGAALGGVIGSAVMPGMGTAAGTAIGGYLGGEATMGEGGMTQRAAALRRIGIGAEGGGGPLQMGGGFTTGRADISRGMQRAAMRAGGASRKAMGFAQDDEKIAGMKLKLDAAYGNTAKLRKLREENPKGYAAALLGEMGYPVTIENLDMLSVVQREEGIVGDLAVDHKQEAADVVDFPTSFDELDKAQNKAIDDMYALSGGRNVAEGALEGAKIGGGAAALYTGGLLAIPGAMAGGIAGLIEAAATDTGVRREDIERAMTGEGSDIMQRYLGGEIDAKRAQILLRRVKGSKGIGEIIDKIEAGTIDKEAMAGVAKQFTGFRKAEAQIEGLEKVRAMAARGPEEIELGEGQGLIEKEFKDLSLLYRGGVNDTLEREELIEAQKEAQTLASKLTRAQADEFAKAGGVGRQVAALFEVGQVGEGVGMGKKGTKAMVKALEGMGYDLKTDETLASYLKDEEISKKESEDFGKRAAEIIQNRMTETAEARETHNEAMMRLLNVYAESNTTFVRAVGEVLGDKLKDTNAAQDAAETSQQLAQEAK